MFFNAPSPIPKFFQSPGISESSTIQGIGGDADRTWTSTLDRDTRQLASTSPSGRQSVQDFDTFGRPVSSQVPGIAQSLFFYDTLGRPSEVRQVDVEGSDVRSWTNVYGADGFLAETRDPLGRSVLYDRDQAGRVIRQTLPDGRVVDFTHDVNGNVTSITPPSRPLHDFAYNGVNQVEQTQAPDVGVPRQTVYTYNLDHQITRATRPDGKVVDYAYDAAGRPATVTSPLGVESYSYDPVTGQPMQIQDVGGGTMTFGFDGGLLESLVTTGEVPGRLDLEYDDYLRPEARSFNQDPGTRVASIFSDDDEVIEVDIGGQGTMTFDYDADNGLLQSTAVGGLTQSFTHNAFAEMTSTASYLNTVGNWVYEADYTRDVVGRVTAKTERLRDPFFHATETQDSAHVYDPVGRLVEVQRNGAVVATYSYDGNSNRTTWTDDFGSHTATYDDQDRLITFDGVTYTYNAAGDLETRTESGVTRTFDYDVFGNLRHLTLDDGSSIDYVIDPMGRRVGKKINGTLVKGWLYKDSLNPGAELDANGEIESLFVYGSQGYGLEATFQRRCSLSISVRPQIYDCSAPECRPN